MDDGSPLLPDSPAPGIETHRQRQAIAERLFGVATDPVRVARFEIVERLGQGAMGIVYRAFDPELRRDVALKVLHAGLGSSDSEPGPELLEEARTLAGLSHPNVVAILDVGAHDGRPYVAMELVAGGTLSQYEAAQPGDPAARTDEVLALFEQAASGLAAAHGRGVIHRDIKPANMLRGEDGRVRLADFGLAHHDGSASTDASRPDADEGSRSRHALAGTLVYMAPERFDGAPASVQSDVFALCVSLWEVLYGARPFAGSTVEELRAALGRGAPSPPATPQTSRRLQRLLARGLSPDPADRFASAEELRAALHACRTRAGGRWRWAAGAAVTLGIGVGAWAWSGKESPAKPCVDVPADIAAVWTPEERTRTRDAFVGAIGDHGAALFDAVGPRMDEVANAWTASWRDNCEATWIAHSQAETDHELRTHCLDRARVALVAYARDLVAATTDAPDPVAVRRVADRIVDLPDVKRCEDLQALRSETPLPVDPAVRAEVLELEQELSAWRATAYGGPPDLARASIDALVARAEATGHPPIVVQALGDRASLLADARDDQAITERERALDVAERAGLDAHAAKVAVDLFNDMRLLGKDEDAARQYLRRAEAHLQRVGDTPQGQTARAHLLHFQAVTLEDDGEREAALEKRRERLAHFERTLGPAHVTTALARENLGVALLRLARFDEAEAELRRALADIDAEVPPNLDAQTNAVGGLAMWAIQTQHGEEAVKLAERMVELTAVSLGPDHPRRISVWNHLGAAKATAGDKAGGIAAFEASLRLADRVLPKSDRQRIATRLHLAKTVEDRQRRLTLLAEARDLALEHVGGGSVMYADAMLALASQGWMTEDWDLTLSSLRDTIDVFEKHGRPTMAIDAHAYLSMALTAKGQLQHALDQAEAALAIADGIESLPRTDYALPYLARARAHHAAGRKAKALADITEAEKAAAGWKTSNAAVTRIAKLAAELRGQAPAPTR